MSGEKTKIRLNDPDDLGKTLKSLRVERGWTQRYVARKLGVTRQCISKMENKFSYSKMTDLGKLVSLLNTCLMIVLYPQENVSLNLDVCDRCLSAMVGSSREECGLECGFVSQEFFRDGTGLVVIMYSKDLCKCTAEHMLSS